MNIYEGKEKAFKSPSKKKPIQLKGASTSLAAKYNLE